MIVAVSRDGKLGERPPPRRAQQWETIGEQPDGAPGIPRSIGGVSLTAAPTLPPDDL